MKIISYCNTFLFVERMPKSVKKSWLVTLAFISSSVKFKDLDNLHMVFSFSLFYISIPMPGDTA